ncbi:alpha/beta fold hydrolase [Lacisediminihabitans profunda]|uniref:Alpha/beta hydrolase n=1 Tax=Lacisediminihabitans profunda TaxID=2594790 RepID=A0A5C8URJ7_9MICO|nr:alpha/beta hydrolase [Lacisediminihabitans profunda]TXN30585.1 alpha/beta hydrolase [Lacisediminihabitans profunda]
MTESEVARVAAATLNRVGTDVGRPILVLHGGGGPFTVAPIVARYLSSHPVFAPTLPGWNGTARPETADSVPALARGYLDALLADGLQDVLVIGSSMGGWMALEMAALAGADEHYANVIAGVAVIDATGITVAGETIADVFSLDARGLAEVAWFEPDRGYRDPSAFTPGQLAAQRANQDTMRAIAGDPYMHDPTLASRLQFIAVPTAVLWGEGDGVVTPAYGRALAAAVPGAVFALLSRAGHLPQIERPEELWPVLDGFVQTVRGTALPAGY